MFRLMLSAGLPLDDDSVRQFHRQASIWHSEDVAENIIRNSTGEKTRDELRMAMESSEIPGFIADQVLDKEVSDDSVCLLERKVIDDFNDVAFDAVRQFQEGDFSFIPSVEDVDVVSSINTAIAKYLPLFYSFVSSKADIFLSQGDYLKYEPTDIEEKATGFTRHIKKYKSVFDPNLVNKHENKLGKIASSAADKRTNLVAFMRSKGARKRKSCGKTDDYLDGLIMRMKESYSLGVKGAQRIVDMAMMLDGHDKRYKIPKKDRKRGAVPKKRLYFSGEDIFLTDIFGWGVIKPMGYPLDMPNGRLTLPMITLETEVGTGDKTKKMDAFTRDARNLHELRHKIYLPVIDHGKLKAGFVWDCHVTDFESIILNDFGPLNQYGYSMKKDRKYASDAKYGRYYEEVRDKLCRFFDACDLSSFSMQVLSEKAASFSKETGSLVDILSKNHGMRRADIFPAVDEDSLLEMRKHLFSDFFNIDDEDQAKMLVHAFPEICANPAYDAQKGVNVKNVRKAMGRKAKDKNIAFNRSTYKYLRASASRIDRLLSTREVFDYDLDSGEIIMDENLDEELKYNIFFRHARIEVFKVDKFATNHINKSIALSNGIRGIYKFLEEFCYHVSEVRQSFYLTKEDPKREEKTQAILRSYEAAEQIYENLVLEGHYHSSPHTAVKKAWARIGKRVAADLMDLERHVERYKISSIDESR